MGQQWEVRISSSSKGKTQLLKYLNKESTDMKDTFKEIPKGVLNRLEKTTSRKEDNARISIDERYPGHTRSLAKAGLNIRIFPTLK